MIKAPYLLFLGDAHDMLAAKVAIGIKDWRPQNCVGQLKLEGCQAECGLENMSIAQARAAGAKTLVIGVANRGGVISEKWIAILKEALESGMDLAAGLHNKLADIPELKTLAEQLGRKLFDVRHPCIPLPVGSGKKRQGKRILPVGTDCSCGKMYTTLALEAELTRRGIPADFRGTGQTGILISGNGISIDAVVADFISGAVEVISPDNTPEHWDCIEGQGSLFHPSFSGVTMGLIHGAQPDALVLCHEPTRKTMRGVDYPLPEIGECMKLSLQVAQLTNPKAQFVGIAVNTSKLNEQEAISYLKELEQQYKLPTVDPVRQGVARIVDNMLAF